MPSMIQLKLHNGDTTSPMDLTTAATWLNDHGYCRDASEIVLTGSAVVALKDKDGSQLVLQHPVELDGSTVCLAALQAAVSGTLQHSLSTAMSSQEPVGPLQVKNLETA